VLRFSLFGSRKYNINLRRKSIAIIQHDMLKFKCWVERKLLPRARRTPNQCFMLTIYCARRICYKSIVFTAQTEYSSYSQNFGPKMFLCIFRFWRISGFFFNYFTFRTFLPRYFYEACNPQPATRNPQLAIRNPQPTTMKLESLYGVARSDHLLISSKFQYHEATRSIFTLLRKGY